MTLISENFRNLREYREYQENISPRLEILSKFESEKEKMESSQTRLVRGLIDIFLTCKFVSVYHYQLFNVWRLDTYGQDGGAGGKQEDEKV